MSKDKLLTKIFKGSIYLSVSIWNLQYNSQNKKFQIILAKKELWDRIRIPFCDYG